MANGELEEEVISEESYSSLQDIEEELEFYRKIKNEEEE